MKTIDSLKKQVQENFKKSKEKEKLLITLSRDAFRKTLSTPNGIGPQDFKPTYLDLYVWMMKKYGANLIVKCTNPTSSNIEMKFYCK